VTTERVAAIAFVERYDGRILAVWNRKHGAWTFPGGKVEPGECTDETALRELKEETDCDGSRIEYITGRKDSNGYLVYVYRVEIDLVFQQPKETEEGCPVTWFTREEFLKYGLYPDFYRKVFEVAP
jgi:8-oxo-dGTP pyrophosphatase MutT (NUDIX family)